MKYQTTSSFVASQQWWAAHLSIDIDIERMIDKDGG
jgi:hypothetical protein